jgi:hypothetical protein
LLLVELCRGRKFFDTSWIHGEIKRTLFFVYEVEVSEHG